MRHWYQIMVAVFGQLKTKTTKFEKIYLQVVHLSAFTYKAFAFLALFFSLNRNTKYKSTSPRHILHN